MTKNYNYEYVSDAYKEILNDLINNPEYKSAPRKYQCHEITNACITIEKPNFNLYNNTARGSQLKYICAELLWYFSGRNDIGFISKYAKMWDLIKNEDGTVNSAYGHLLFKQKNIHGYTQWAWALESLLRDSDTRQAFMHFNKPEHQFAENNDQVCTLTGLFQIRNNKLNFTVNMRSNDAILGFMTDFAFFNILHQQMRIQLLDKYPQLEIGTYTHIVNSMHIYERNFEIAKKMLESIFIPDALPELNSSLLDNKCNMIYDHSNNLIDYCYKVLELDPDFKI